jgi:hypothetical protein
MKGEVSADLSSDGDPGKDWGLSETGEQVRRPGEEKKPLRGKFER